MSLKIVRIFIASSAELKEDRDEFRNFISVENERLITQNIFLQIVQWEYFLDAISYTRLQNEYNKALRECDIVLFLFFTKAGKYTAEEFDTAYQVFKITGRPFIWTYFKDAPVNMASITEEIATLIAFKKKISELGHFHTVYTNIDNFKYQFRNQLDKILPKLTGQSGRDAEGLVESQGLSKNKETEKNNFNEKLTRRLIEAIQVYSPRAKKFLDNASRIAADWETQERFSDPAKEIIAFSFVGVLGIQLRKLIAIGKEEFSADKPSKYIANCQLTCKRALQLLCFALLSKLWDYKKDTDFTLTSIQATVCGNFFDDEFEPDINGFIDLLKNLVAIYSENDLALPIAEITEFKSSLNSDTGFITACSQLQALDVTNVSFTYNDCIHAEENLATILEALKFLANYKMISVKSIGYFEMRNSLPHYLCCYTALGIDIKANINQDKINYTEVPVNTDAVLLYKGNYQQNLNLFPFVIDVNALALEGGAKICFYTSHNNADDSLNYIFLEDNSPVNIVNTKTLKSGLDINELLMDPAKKKDMRFDTVFTLFREARKAITGIEDEEDYENPL